MAVMALSDFCILLSHELIHSVWDGKDIPYYVCKIGIFVFYYSLHMSVALLVTMTAEKYISIKYPLHSLSWITRRKCIFVIIILALFMAIIDGHIFATIEPGKHYGNDYKSCRMITYNEKYISFISAYRWVDTTIYCFIPISCLVLLNGLIIWHLTQSTTGDGTLSGRGFV